jgi:hypothetical protein
MYPVIGHIVSLTGSSITLSDISYQIQTATSASITLQGRAADRQSLLSFTQTLETNGHFQNVDLPVSSFAKDTDIDFSISLNTSH